MSRLLAARKLLGLIFLSLVLLAGYLTYAVFTKKFTDYERVELLTSSVGLQLPQRADVKIRGVIVGEVLQQRATAAGATVQLGLYPAETQQIPANVSASILPKTLFGEKYVSLIVPDRPRGEISAGDTIARTAVATEVEEVLNDLYPLLTTVQPAKIDMTLNAISTALEGRGNQLGETIVDLDDYLRRLNPQIPALIEDLRLATSVSKTYSEILPQIGDILTDTITTTSTLQGREARLSALFSDITAVSGTTEGFLQANGPNLITLGQVSVPTLQVLSRYAPEFPCLLKGVVDTGTRFAEAFRDFTLHISLETLPNQPRAYTVDDRPRIASDRGPTCLSLAAATGSQADPFDDIPNFDDGVDEPTGKGTSRAATDYGSAADSGSATDNGQGYIGGPGEAGVLRSLLAPGMGVAESDVPDLGVLLIGPMARGATVSVG